MLCNNTGIGVITKKYRVLYSGTYHSTQFFDVGNRKELGDCVLALKKVDSWSIVTVSVVVMQTNTCSRQGMVYSLAAIPKILLHPGRDHINCGCGRFTAPDLLMSSPF